jgi:hypothetical protein
MISADLAVTSNLEPPAAVKSIQVSWGFYVETGESQSCSDFSGALSVVTFEKLVLVPMA